jgi:outer membrane protein insertion porin family
LQANNKRLGVYFSRLAIFMVLALFLLLNTSPVFPQSSNVVRDIVVEGIQRIEPDTVRSYLLIQEGDAFDSERVDRSLKSLFATGLFDDVSITQRGDSLVINVVENPIINRIAFEGNVALSDESLKAEVTLKPRVIYTRSTVQNDVERILNIYRRTGRFGATVEPKVITLEQNRIDLVFEIDEGVETEIERIRFVGNKDYSDSRLREEIRTKESAWYRFLSSDDTFDPERLNFDRELLRQFYLHEGYADFKVQSAVAELTPDRKDFFVTFTVDEGDRYQFGKIDIVVRLRDLAVEDLSAALEIMSGDWYDSRVVDSAVNAISDVVGARGFAFVDVYPRVVRNQEEKTINLTFEVGEGPRVFIERIEIVGNVRTLGKVIRREFRLVEGDAFSTTKLERSRQRIQNLNYFESVSVEEEAGSAAGMAVIKVKVTEKSTGSIAIGGGYSTDKGPLADLTITENNLLGRGQRLSLTTTLALKGSQIDLSYTEPYFLDREILSGIDIFRTTKDNQDSSSFDNLSLGGALRIGYPVTEDLSQAWKYELKQTEVSGIPANASAVVKASAGKVNISEVKHTITYDKRNNLLVPTDGYVVRAVTDVAGGIGDSQYMRNQVAVAQYYPIYDQWVLSLSGKAGYIFDLGKPLSISDRFYSSDSHLRGFENAGIGPRDRATEDALGGEWSYAASAELNFPIRFLKEVGVSGRFFTDMGSNGGIDEIGEIDDVGSLRASFGAGLSYASPFGLIGIDVGFPVLSEDFDKTQTFRVNFGTRF